MSYYELTEERDRAFKNICKCSNRIFRICDHIAINLLKGKEYRDRGMKSIEKIKIKKEKYRIKYKMITKQIEELR